MAESLGALLATLRKRRGLSTPDVAKRLGVARSTAYAWEGGGRPSADTLGRLLKLYQADTSEELLAWRLRAVRRQAAA